MGMSSTQFSRLQSGRWGRDTQLAVPNANDYDRRTIELTWTHSHIVNILYAQFVGGLQLYMVLTVNTFIITLPDCNKQTAL